MIREKQVQDISGLKINLDQILVDCSLLKPDSYIKIYPKRSLRLKTQPSLKFNLEKSLDFDTCIKNINTKVRSLQSAKLGSQTLFNSMEKKKLSMSDNYIRNLQHSPYKSPSKTENYSNQTKFTHLPRIMAKYQKAYSPRNASSSQKCSLLQKQKPEGKERQSEEPEKYESYHSMVGERKLKEELSFMLVMGRVVKENLVKERKILQQRKKKRKLDSLKMKEVLVFKRTIPNL